MQTIDPSPLDTTVAVLPTPFLEDGSLDLAGLEHLLRRAVEGGLRAVTIAGNTGEFGALSADEIGRLIDVAVATLTGRAALLVGVGGDLSTAREVASRAAGAGTTPSWRAPSQGWPSCRMSGTQPSGLMTFERSPRPRRTWWRSSTRSRIRSGSQTS